MQLVRIKQDNKNQKLKTIKQGLYYRPQINKEDTFSQKMVNENQEVLVSSVLSKEKSSSSSSTSIQPPRGQRQEPEKKISNSFEIELDPFTTVVLSQL